MEIQQPEMEACEDDKYKITIEPVYFNRTMMRFKTIAKCTFYGAFSAVVFLVYLKILSSPLLAVLYSVLTAVIFAASIPQGALPIGAYS